MIINPQPPRLGQAILSSLGAPAELRDPILGDLTEQYAERVERSDVMAANVWYYHQVARNTPHLVRHWLSSASAGDLRTLLRDLAYTYVITLTADYALLFVLGMASLVLGSDVFRDAGPILISVVAVGAPIFAGFTAASLHRRAPLIAAGAFGTGMFLLITALLFLIPPGGRLLAAIPAPVAPLLLNAGFRLATAIFAPAGCLYGGIIRLRAGDSVAKWITA